MLNDTILQFATLSVCVCVCARVCAYARVRVSTQLHKWGPREAAHPTVMGTW